jgi:hypothetical protein
MVGNYTQSDPARWTANWRVEDPPANGRVLVAREYQDYDPNTGVYGRLARRYDYTWQGNRFVSTTITDYASDGSVLAVRTEPVYTTAARGRVSPANVG